MGGHAPQGRPITASEGEQGSAQNNKTKKLEKENTKTHPKMLLIGCLGGHAPSGENQWVEGQRGQTAGQRAAAGAGGPLRRVRWRHQSQDCQAWGAEGLDQADSEQMDVSIRYLELWDSLPMCTECSRTDVFWS